MLLQCDTQHSRINTNATAIEFLVSFSLLFFLVRWKEWIAFIDLQPQML